MPAPSINTLTLKQRVFKAGMWSFGGHVTSQVMRLAGNLVMTRLLVPEMFGVMALAGVLMISLQLFSDLGLQQNIVQSRRGNDPIFLNTVWTLQILRGGVIWLLMLGMSMVIYLLDLKHAWPEGSAYAEPILPYVIAIISFSALLGSFESTKTATANRNLALGRIAKNELTSQFAGLVLMLIWAYLNRSIWALVAGALLSSAVKTILSHVALPGIRNRLHWDKEALHDIFKFGKWVFVTSIIGVLSANGDRLLLGGLTDAATLGLYATAFFMVSSLRDVFAKLIGSVAFPAFSEIVRERPEMLKQTYYKFRKPVDITTLLAAGLLFSAGHLVIQILYDSRYFPAGHMLEILSLSLFEVRYSLAGQCFMALGKPKLLVPIILVRLVALFGLLPVAFAWYGFEGALWIAGGSVLLTMPMTIYLKIRLGLLDLIRELRALPWLVIGLGLGWGVEQAARQIGL